MEAKIDGIQTDLDNATDGLGALKILIDANQVDLNSIISDLDNATDGLSALKGLIDANQTDLDTIIADLANATDGLSALKTLIDANQTDLNTIIVDTTAIIADLDNATDGLGALKTLIDANQTDLGVIEGKVDTVDTVVDGIQTDLSNVTDGLGALKTLIDTNQTDLDAIIADLANATDGLGALKTLIDANQVDLNSILVDTGAIEGKVDTVDTVVDGIQTDLSNVTDGLGALKTLIDANQTDLDSILVDTGTNLPNTLATIAAYIDTEVAAIQTDLDNATDGLGALKELIDANQSTLATIEAEVVEIENHTHSRERWLGKAFEDGGYEIAGTTSPDFDGSFYGYATVNTKTAYQNKDGSGFLWWDNVDSWIISATEGVTGTDYFKRTDASAIGAYTNQGSATGTVTGADIADDVHKADDEKMIPFQADAGNDTWGSWLQVMGTDDTPVTSGKVKIDIHRLVISDVEASADKTIHRLQIAWGDSGAAAFTAGDYTCTMFSPEKGGRQDPIDIQISRIAVGTKLWVRHWADGINTSTLDFYFGIHEYAV